MQPTFLIHLHSMQWTKEILATLEWKTLFQQLLKLEERIVISLILTLQKNNKIELVKKFIVIQGGEQEQMTMKLQSSVILFRIENYDQGTIKSNLNTNQHYK
jgi:hypothetical protein